MPDTIIFEADRIIDMTLPNKETFKYVIWYLTFTFETSKVMGLMRFLFIWWIIIIQLVRLTADSSVVKSLEKRAAALHNVLIGNPAQNLILLDTSGGFRSLYHEIAPYTIVLFYEHDCSHCHKEIDALQSWYNDNDIGFEVFAVCVDTSITKWKEFIVEKNMTWVNVNGTRSITPDYHDLYDINMTPTIFLLDEQKKIIAKRIKTEQLRPFLENYDKKRDRNK
ncbi:MAG: redoxin domain-containing protein [Bacteroidales bacterium]